MTTIEAQEAELAATVLAIAKTKLDRSRVQTPGFGLPLMARTWVACVRAKAHARKQPKCGYREKASH